MFLGCLLMVVTAGCLSPEAILERTAPSLVRVVRPTALVEFGSGSAAKTRVLLDAMAEAGLLRGYAPIDVSESVLTDSARVLVADYAGLRVVGVLGDFELPFELPFGAERRLVAFLGSTIGNLTERQAVAFLHRIADGLHDEDAFLVGFDLVKDPRRLERAYNDARGVTAEFNLNVLRVLNRELGADFDLSAFRHLAFYDPEKSRIEMHLVSTREQTVRLEALDLRISFREGETIRTELSHKYTRTSAERLLAAGGLRLSRWETDPETLFALALARRRVLVAGAGGARDATGRPPTRAFP